MPKVIDIRDTVPIEEIVISDEHSVRGFHKPEYDSFELLQDGNYAISLTFEEIDDMVNALRIVKKIREGM